MRYRSGRKKKRAGTVGRLLLWILLCFFACPKVTVLAAEPSVSGAVAIAGTVQFGYTVRADLSGITYTDGSGNPEAAKDTDTYTYKWLLGGQEVSTTEQYKIRQADVGKTLRLEITYTGPRKETTGLTTFAEATVGKTALPAPAGFAIEYKMNVDEQGTITYNLMIPAAAGCEYSYDGYNWSETVRGKRGVKPGESVTAYRRYRATAFSEVSDASVAHLTLPVIPAETAYLDMAGAGDTAQQQAVRDALTAEQQAAADAASGRNDPAQAADIYSMRAAGAAEAGGADGYISRQEQGAAGGGGDAQGSGGADTAGTGEGADGTEGLSGAEGRHPEGADLEFVPIGTQQTETGELPQTQSVQEAEAVITPRLLLLAILSAAVVAGGFTLLIFGTEKTMERRNGYG